MDNIRSIDYVSQKRYKVSVVVGLKTLVNNIVRYEHSERIYLNSTEGVQRYLDETQPFVSAEIIDLLDKKDITECFKIVYCNSRYTTKIQAMRNEGGYR